MGLDLTTLSRYKAYAGLTSPAQDAAISSIIPKVSQLVKTVCRRTFVDYVSTPKTEITSGGSGAHIFLSEYPLLSIASFSISEDFGKTYEPLIEDTDYVVDRESESLYDIVAGNFGKRVNGYKIVYYAGYTTVPEDLEIAVFDLITYYLRNDMAVHSSKAPGTNSVQIEYVTTTNLPAHIKRILDLYTGMYT